MLMRIHSYLCDGWHCHIDFQQPESHLLSPVSKTIAIFFPDLHLSFVIDEEVVALDGGTREDFHGVVL